jgi:hypothetical protein
MLAFSQGRCAESLEQPLRRAHDEHPVILPAAVRTKATGSEKRAAKASSAAARRRSATRRDLRAVMSRSTTPPNEASAKIRPTANDLSSRRCFRRTIQDTRRFLLTLLSEQYAQLADGLRVADGGRARRMLVASLTPGQQVGQPVSGRQVACVGSRPQEPDRLIDPAVLGDLGRPTGLRHASRRRGLRRLGSAGTRLRSADPDDRAGERRLGERDRASRDGAATGPGAVGFEATEVKVPNGEVKVRSTLAGRNKPCCPGNDHDPPPGSGRTRR